MKRVLAALVMLLGLAYGQTAKEENYSHIVLPNPKLLRCGSSDCSRLWLEQREVNAVFPKQLLIDMNQDCLYGLQALYDKSVSVQDIEVAIDEHYLASKNTDFEKSPLRLWRAESEKFAIQLSADDKKDVKKQLADEAGTKRIIYIAFGGRSACNIP
jgi:hypothetical protein